MTPDQLGIAGLRYSVKTNARIHLGDGRARRRRLRSDQVGFQLLWVLAHHVVSDQGNLRLAARALCGWSGCDAGFLDRERPALQWSSRSPQVGHLENGAVRRGAMRNFTRLVGDHTPVFIEIAVHQPVVVDLLHLLTHDYILLDDALGHCRDKDFIRQNFGKHMKERMLAQKKR